MKVLRVTVYSPLPDLLPTSMIVREVDLRGDIADAVQSQQDAPGMFVITDVFEADAGAEIEDVTLVAIQRQTEAVMVERDMAVLFYWDAAHMSRVKKGGTISTSKPAPLTHEQVTTVLLQLANHPDYDGHTVICHTRDGHPVKLMNGEIAGPSDG